MHSRDGERKGARRPRRALPRSEVSGALTSLAGNVDAHHQVTVVDLILAQRSVAAMVEGWCATTCPPWSACPS
jgi:hypothetical protein